MPDSDGDVTAPDQVPAGPDVIPERPYLGTPLATGPAGCVYGTGAGTTVGPWSRVLVTGSRDWTDRGAVWGALTIAWRDAGQPLTVVQGGCPTGADLHAREWAAEHAFAGHELEEHPADWRCHGRVAGPIRNHAMVMTGAWRVLAFILDGSRGASGCADFADHVGLDVRRIDTTTFRQRRAAS